VVYEVVWAEEALDQAMRLAKTDREGVAAVFDATDLLAGNPRPEGAFRYGSVGALRLHVGLYRVFIEVDDDASLVKVRHLGRV
jgi:mRNA interferase RelE/StbE